MVNDWFPADASEQERAEFEADFDREFRPRGQDWPYTSRDYVFDGDHDDCPGQAAAAEMMFLLWRRARAIQG